MKPKSLPHVALGTTKTTAILLLALITLFSGHAGALAEPGGAQRFRSVGAIREGLSPSQWSGILQQVALAAQQAYVKASNPGSPDQFAHAVAVSGDTLVIGASYEDSDATGVNGTQDNDSATDSGAAYVFVRNGTNWSQQAYLKASNTDPDDRFYKVAVSGDIVVVGAPRENSDATGVNGDQNNNDAADSGAAYVFVRSGTNWSQHG